MSFKAYTTNSMTLIPKINTIFFYLYSIFYLRPQMAHGTTKKELRHEIEKNGFHFRNQRTRIGTIGYQTHFPWTRHFWVSWAPTQHCYHTASDAQNIVKNDVSIKNEIDSSYYQIDHADFENQHHFALS
jgi:hypothetical protein